MIFPHLLIPVVTNPRKASKALQKVVDEMETVMNSLLGWCVRNIAGYNAKVEEFNSQSGVQTSTASFDCCHCRRVSRPPDGGQQGSGRCHYPVPDRRSRAAGIHMILATQRPSVDVISGLIKANVPSRVAFAVSSGTDHEPS